jgi:hypothetical protein
MKSLSLLTLTFSVNAALFSPLFLHLILQSAAQKFIIKRKFSHSAFVPKLFFEFAVVATELHSARERVLKN